MKNWFQWQFRKKQTDGILNFSKKRNKKIALVIYAPWAVKAFSEGSFKDADFNGHSMHWESIEMVKCLAAEGYNVDYIDCLSPLPGIDWGKYQLVIDERGNLYDHCEEIKCPKIFYATGCDSQFHNDAEEERLSEFNKKFGLNFSAQRKVSPILSGQVADITTYFGNDFQKNLFPKPGNTFLLNLSTVYLPSVKSAYPIEERRKNFIWLGSRGFIHKGLDIVVEAFAEQPDLNLHICTDLTVEPEFYEWYKKVTRRSGNIFYHGFLVVSSAGFSSIIKKCIAIPFLSCAEGGGGAVLQAMQFNCFPIVNKSTALRGHEFGILLEADKREDLLNELKKSLDLIRNLTGKKLEQMATASGQYSRKNHSRKAYAVSFKELLSKIHEKN